MSTRSSLVGLAAVELCITVGAAGCRSSTAPSTPVPATFAPEVLEPTPEGSTIDLGRWQPEVVSPRRPSTVVEPALLERCGSPDGALQAVAAKLAEGNSKRSALDMPALEFELRVAGAPYVWPHVWTVASKELRPDDVSARFERWLATFAEGGDRRCGLARDRDAEGRDRIVAVVVDALADLSSFPSSSSVGRWLDLEARLLGETSDASVVLLGPRGRPTLLPSSLSNGLVKARFAPSQPGRWLVQVVAHTDSGPRPVARAVVYVDASPPQQFVNDPVPGEDSNDGEAPPDVAFARMLNAARASEGLPRLPRSAALDAVARAHAEAMRATGQLGHDVGNGNVLTRLDDAGVAFDTAGENVARAGSVQRAHRVLWESPSHRDTLLFDRYDALGVGIATEGNGTVWVCAIFARL